MSPEPAAERNNSLVSLVLYPQGNPRFRVIALWYFCILMTVWNFVGRTVLGFEQSFLQYAVAVGTAIGVQMLLDWVDARQNDRPLRFTGSFTAFLNFLPPPIIAGSAISMLLFPNERLLPFAFASTLAIGSKGIFRAPIGNGQTQHVFNPSNLGIATTLFLLPWVGHAPPYHFTNRIESQQVMLIIPFAVLASGIFLHWRYTGRLPLTVGWLGGFVLQAFVRSLVFGAPLHVLLVPMTGSAFVIFTLYMIPDPATTPIRPLRQLLFGLATAAVYGMLFALHVVFALMLSLVIVCATRAVILYAIDFLSRKPEVLPVPAAVASA